MPVPHRFRPASFRPFAFVACSFLLFGRPFCCEVGAGTACRARRFPDVRPPCIQSVLRRGVCRNGTINVKRFYGQGDSSRRYARICRPRLAPDVSYVQFRGLLRPAQNSFRRSSRAERRYGGRRKGLRDASPRQHGDRLHSAVGDAHASRQHGTRRDALRRRDT